MKSTLKIAAVLAVAGLAMTGCANRFQGDAQAAGRGPTAFDSALVTNYKKLSDIEYASGDAKDGDTYALRAIAAGQGKPTTPDDLKLRQIPAGAQSEINQGRQRLVAALDKNGRTSKPEVAAYAQASFDCWAEQLQENLQPDAIAACRDAFMKSLAELEKPAPAPAAAPAKPSDFLVFFDWDKYNLTPEALKIITDAVNAAKKEGAKAIKVVGHTDTSGPADYNLRLSERRANAVAQQMIKLGIPATAITTVGRGEEDLLVPTKDGVREPQNRRAAISFPRGSASLDNTYAVGIYTVN
ncbi:MAG: OmpA family protein [Rhodospirillales bacterium]